MPAFETPYWTHFQNEAHLIDAWTSSMRQSAGYTFHSLSHDASRSKLDRVYYVGADWLPNNDDEFVDVAIGLSSHFPLVLDLSNIKHVA
ncbi:hypothetical protein GOP47_0006492 [Adiantum capillus-veneris]|uniref:Uncharacterized protein n=1 Tax=Adiantum capillus-veneris TaxID=13818 RepID=A0A9D4ZMJ3_ADICA|nr:hypothetical protein GOP47_0006492 [Adiantum capillus-veneris]